MQPNAPAGRAARRHHAARQTLEISDIHPVFLSAGQDIFAEGDRGDGLYQIDRGKVEIWRERDDGKQTIAILEAGTFFGEMALIDDARTGAQVIDAIAADSGGHWRPKPGAVYPLLQLLADEGLVAPEQRDDKKVYALTEAGRAAAEAAAAEQAAHDHDAHGSESHRGGRGGWSGSPFPRMDEHDVLVPKSGAKLAQAAAQVAQVGTADQKKRAAELLDETRKRLYAILAED